MRTPPPPSSPSQGSQRIFFFFFFLGENSLNLSTRATIGPILEGDGSCSTCCILISATLWIQSNWRLIDEGKC